MGARRRLVSLARRRLAAVLLSAVALSVDRRISSSIACADVVYLSGDEVCGTEDFGSADVGGVEDAWSEAIMGEKLIW